MKKYILPLLFISSSAFAFYDFDRINYYFDKQFEKLGSELENIKAESFSSNSSMRYFDEAQNAYVVKIRTTIAKENINIKTHKNYLIISGKENTQDAQENFQQTMSLPKDANLDAINAQYENQILTISIPRKAINETEFKTIEIK